MNYAVLLAFCFALIACATDDDLPAPPGSTIGQCIEVNGQSLCLNAIEEDSTCPCHLDCRWAGEIVLQLVSTTQDTFLLTSFPGTPSVLPNRISYNDRTVTLVGVERKTCEGNADRP